MQQNSQDFNAFWKTLFSFITTKLASFVCWKWWRRRKGEKKSAGLKFNGSEENGFWRREVHHLPSVVSFKDNFNAKLRDWVLGLRWFMAKRQTRPFHKDSSSETSNAPFRRHRKLRSRQPCKISVTSSIDKSFDLFSWWKYFQTFPHSDGKTWKTAFRSMTAPSSVSLLQLFEKMFSTQMKNKFPRIAKAFSR